MDDRLFRNAMGKFATGVTVILTETEGKVHGMTANAFMSVSLNPKLAAVAVAQKAKMTDLIKQNGKFTVNILTHHQIDLSMLFAGQVQEQQEIRFDRLDGQPVIHAAVTQIACELFTHHVEGDHVLFVGKVTEIQVSDDEPLVFFGGHYRTLLTGESVTV